MNFLKKTRIILILIIVLAAFLRLPFLGSLPIGITIDEAGQGYSAYSILKTGSDEWGDFLPLNPRGFGDYKPPVFMYLLVPPIAIFGLNEFAVRFPSAIAGILTVLIVFYLVKDLFESKNLGLLAAFLMAISPCLVYYSRLGWESNIGLMFFILGIWLFNKGMEKGKYLAVSAISFGLAGLSYHSFKLLVPLMVLSLVIIFWKQIKRIDRTTLFLTSIVIVIFVLLLGYGFLFSGASRRAQDQSIMKAENLSELWDKQFNDGLPRPLNKIVNNKYQFLASKITDNYLGYFSIPFLFGPHRSASSVLNFPSMGLLYIWQLPLILLGIRYLFKNNLRQGMVLFSWLIVAPIPASLTQDYMHAGRAQAMFPVLTIISAFGVYSTFDYLKSWNLKNFFIVTAILIILLSVFLRIDNYLFHTFNKPLGGLKQGYKQLIDFTNQNYDKYDKIIFTKFDSEPHAFISFYSKLDPIEVQKASSEWKKFETDDFRFLDMTDYKLGKYEFRNIDFARDRNEKNALIIASPEEISPIIPTKTEFQNDWGKTIFVVIDTNEIPK